VLPVPLNCQWKWLTSSNLNKETEGFILAFPITIPMSLKLIFSIYLVLLIVVFVEAAKKQLIMYYQVALQLLNPAIRLFMMPLLKSSIGSWSERGILTLMPIGGTIIHTCNAQ